MNPVNSIGTLLEVFRKRTEDSVPAKALKSRARQRSSPSSLESIRQQVLDALNGISPDEPGHQQKAMRVFVEKVLLWRFGQELVADPAFHRMVDELSLEMEGDAVMQEMLSALKHANR